jgi:mycofactocin precursor
MAGEPIVNTDETGTDIDAGEAVVEDVLVEEVSIDGMCGVY